MQGKYYVRTLNWTGKHKSPYSSLIHISPMPAITKPDSPAFSPVISLPVAALFIFCFLISCEPKRSSGADLVLVNGKIITVDSAFNIVEAVAIQHERF